MSSVAHALQQAAPRRGKRVLDLALAIPGLILALPIILIAAVIIRYTSEGPAIYAQTRAGRDAIPFRCYKLRTMYVGTPSVATHEAKPTAITPIGRFLRKTKIDELPQLWNVLKGEMSIVGPRPCLPEQEELIGHRMRLGVFAAAPGITGLAQLRGIDMSRPEACAQADAEYLSTWSIGRDLALMARTLLPRS